MPRALRQLGSEQRPQRRPADSHSFPHEFRRKGGLRALLWVDRPWNPRYV